MKIAACFSGQPRNVQRGYNYIWTNIFEVNSEHEIDVFVHVWFDSDDIGRRYINAGGHVASDVVPPNILDIIDDLYNPVVMESEKQIQFDERNYNERKYPGIKPFNSLSQRYSLWKAQELRRQFDKEYDVALRLRFDFAIQTPISLSKLDMNKVNTPNRCPHPGGVDDTFAASKPKNMDVYGDLYNKIDEIYNIDGVPFCDELLLGQQLLKNGIEVARHPFQYELIRN